MKRCFILFSLLFFSVCVLNFHAKAESVPELSDAVAQMKTQIASQTAPSGPFSTDIVVCDQFRHKILILKAGEDWSRPGSVVWEWSPEMSPQIRPEHYRWFRNPDECKPALGTSHLLMTASGGGIALIRLADKACLFYSRIEGNPHSIELLPDGNIVSVSSGGLFTIWAVPEGNDAIDENTRLEPNPKGRQYPLVGGHGVVWDDEMQILWVLGYDELAGYEYDFNKKDPALSKVFSISVNGTFADGGHDLYPVPDQRAFFLTGRGIGIYDIEKKEFISLVSKETHPKGMHSVKSVSQSPEGFLIIQSPTTNYWSPRIPFFNQKLSPIGTLPDGMIYKARGWVEKWK